jgi:hypothetical protein
MVKETLEHRLAVYYPAITVTGVVAQLVVFPGIIAVRYYGAVRVFLQRDDGTSNLHWYYNISSWTWWMTQRDAFRAWKKKRHSVSSEGGLELIDNIQADEAGTALLGGPQDKRDMSLGDSSHGKDINPERYPVEAIQLPEVVFTPFQGGRIE